METKNCTTGVKWLALFFFVGILLAHAPVFAAKARSFNTVVVEYNVNANPQISSKKFRSRVSVFEQDAVKIIEIKNFIRKKRAPDGIVKIVRSGTDVASAVYNGKMEVRVEYPKGKIVGKNLYTFIQTNGNRTIRASWFISEDYIMSDSYMTDENDTLLYKETVIYRAQNPSRKR